MDTIVDKSGVRFSPRKTKSKIYCCVYGCNSKACNDPEVRFHFFPKLNQTFVKVKNIVGKFGKADVRKIWQSTLKIGKNLTKYMQICSFTLSKK